MSSATQQLIRPGSAVLAGVEVLEVLDFVDLNHVLLIDPQGKQQKWAIRDLKPLHSRAPTRRRELADPDRKKWNEALDRFRFVVMLMNLPEEKRTLEEVQRVAKLLEVHPATVYRWIERYKKTGTVSGLMRAPRGDAGQHRLIPEVEQLIATKINELFLTQQRKSMQYVAKEIRQACERQKIPAPDASTVRARIYALDPKLVEEKRYGKKLAGEKYDPLLGSFPNADFPLAVVQIDHTPMDVIVVDDTWRKPINRAYLTLAIDVKSKMVVGFYISLDHPGELATGQCLINAILDKQEWLAQRGLSKYEWPCRGKMRTIHTDNAKEFKGTMLALACKDHQINHERRPKGKPRYGGHIERGFGTFMRKIHAELPGTTFSSVAHRFDYDSEGKAVMTLAALEKWLAMYLLGYYHVDNHAGNDGIPPLVEWKRAYLEGTADTPPAGVPHRVENEAQLRLDFLPFVMRSVQEYGIRYEGLEWYSDSIRRFIHSKDEKKPSEKRLFICRFDPRDMSILNVWDEKAKTYIEVPFRNRNRPPVSLWEVRRAKKELVKEAKKSSNEELIFRTIDEMRGLVQEEAQFTKSARRAQQRQKEWEKVQKQGIMTGKPVKQIAPKSPTVTLPEDLIDLEPFEGIRES